ncbi:MAG TPA: WYL domain-containing protein [Microlunatus sp.]|nr:WYL domain-containing protein [Microlunatus sp.]
MATETSPTARALSALELIQAIPGVTAERLAERLGVSERAVRRYVGILREAGLPIESERGPYGGYRVGRGLRLPPLVFSATEALGLVMAVLDGHHSAGDPEQPVGAALDKIIRALPEPIAAPAEAVRRTAATAPDRAAARPDPVITADLVRACSLSHRVRLDYRSETGKQWVTDVDPWAIVVRHGRWYLLCWSHAAAARRAYRVDRIQTAEVLDEVAPRPELDDPVAVLEEHLAAGWEYSAEVVFTAALDDLRPWLTPALGRLEAVDDRHTRLTGTTSNPHWFVHQLVYVPYAFEITEGDEVRRAAGELGRHLLAACGG